jgi:uncharacterized protein YjbI with pentapeptide repeats
MPPPSDAQLRNLASLANEAAQREAPQWIGFITLMVYLAISVGTTTHRALLDQKPMRLPLLNVELPLVTFFWVAPAILVILHFYLQAQLATVTGRVERFFRAAEARAAADADAGLGAKPRLLEALLEPLDAFAGAQHAAAAAASRRIALTRLMTTASVTVAPALLLGFFLLKFLPYQAEDVTWLHRGMILATILSALYFRAVQAEPGMAPWRFLITLPRRVAARDGRLPQRMLLLGGVAAFFSVATVRGEAIDWPAHPLRLPWLLYDGQPWETNDGEPRERAFHVPQYLFSRVLVLPYETLITISLAEIDRDYIARSVVLRGRNLRGAVLTASDLRKADLEAADLRGARLDRAWLDQAYLNDAKLHGVQAKGTRFRGAWLNTTHLAAAVLDGADFRGAQMQRATLHGASLRKAMLQAAALEHVRAAGADFSTALMQAALLLHGRFQGAQFIDTDLRAADFRLAQLWRADFADANLHYASLPALREQQDGPPHGLDALLAKVPPGQALEKAAGRLAALASVAAPARPLERAIAELGEAAEPQDVAAFLNDLACIQEAFPFVLRGVLHQIWEDEPATRRNLPSPWRERLARSLLDPSRCAVAERLPVDSRARLSTISTGHDRTGWRPAALPQ